MREITCGRQDFEDIAAGRKRHDMRRNEGFCIGDHLRLLELDEQKPTGREQVVAITYITSEDSPCALSKLALQDQYCIISIHPIDDAE